MIQDLGNVLSWMEQCVLLATMGALLPMVFRVRHPRTQLAYCHLLLAACFVLPLVQPWKHPTLLVQSGVAAAGTESLPAPITIPNARQPVRSVPIQRTPAQAIARDLARDLPQSIGTRAKDALPWVLTAGIAARLVFLVAGLWQIRRRRIAAMPLYPIPESVQAASAITQTNAVFCISNDAPGPVMLGWLTPVVLLPQPFLDLGDEAQCAIACHELLHVRRNDWMVTLLEEIVAALLWFNPGIWMLLAQARLSREQLVDAEVVRLTAAPDPYIDALLTIARARPGLDLAPAPLFLRRRHLTQRMHLLLKEVSMSKLRLMFSYSSMTAILALAAVFAVACFPLTGEARIQMAPEVSVETPASEVVPAPVAAPAPKPVHVPAVVDPQAQMPPRAPQRSPSVPLSQDGSEPVTGNIHVAASPADRAAALSLLTVATENSRMHIQSMWPYTLNITFQANGTAYSGAGGMTETWISGQKWRWTANLGSFSVVRVGTGRGAFDEQRVASIPSRLSILREAFFWAARNVLSTALRTAPAQVNGKAVTCILNSGMIDNGTPSRLWEEDERCIDAASGTLQLYSPAPGTYAIYGYSKGLKFHSRLVPDRITIYIAGAVAVDAQINLTDAGTVDDSMFTVTQEMMAAGSAVETTVNRFAITVPSALVNGAVRPVIVRATIDTSGNVVDEELSASSDPSLSQTALDLVKQRNFGPGPLQRDAYLNVRFVPQQ